MQQKDFIENKRPDKNNENSRECSLGLVRPHTYSIVGVGIRMWGSKRKLYVYVKTDPCHYNVHVFLHFLLHFIGFMNKAV